MAAAEAGTLSSEAKAMPVPSLGLASHVETNDAASGGSRVVIKGLSPSESNDSSDGHKFVRSVRYVASARARVAWSNALSYTSTLVHTNRAFVCISRARSRAYVPHVNMPSRCRPLFSIGRRPGSSRVMVQTGHGTESRAIPPPPSAPAPPPPKSVKKTTAPPPPPPSSPPPPPPLTFRPGALQIVVQSDSSSDPAPRDEHEIAPPPPAPPHTAPPPPVTPHSNAPPPPLPDSADTPVYGVPEPGYIVLSSGDDTETPVTCVAPTLLASTGCVHA
jgi:hypothetical protein